MPFHQLGAKSHPGSEVDGSSTPGFAAETSSAEPSSSTDNGLHINRTVDLKKICNAIDAALEPLELAEAQGELDAISYREADGFELRLKRLRNRRRL